MTNDDNLSIAVTTMFLTTAPKRRRELYRIKRWQRSLGLPAAPVGRHPRLDALKPGSLETVRRILAPIRQRLRRGPAPAA